MLAEAQFPVSTRFNRVQPRKYFPSQCDNTALQTLQPQAVTLASHLASRGIQNTLRCAGIAEDLCRMTALWCKNAHGNHAGSCSRALSQFGSSTGLVDLQLDKLLQPGCSQSCLPAAHNVAVAGPMWKQARGRDRPWGAQRTTRHCPHWQAASAMRPWWGGQTSAWRFCMWQFPRLSILEHQFTLNIYTEKYAVLQKQLSIRQLHSTAALKVIHLRKKLHWTSCFKC